MPFSFASQCQEHTHTHPNTIHNKNIANKQSSILCVRKFSCSKTVDGISKTEKRTIERKSTGINKKRKEGGTGDNDDDDDVNDGDTQHRLSSL